MKPILTCILFIYLFAGCKKSDLEKIIFKNSFQCYINGRECYSDVKNTNPYADFVYRYNKESKNFNLVFYNYQINEKNSSNSYRLHLGLCTHLLPEIGKEYEMINDDSLHRFVFEKDACWVSFTYLTPFYNYMDTIQLPKKIRKLNSAVRSKKIKGYLVFDEIDQKKSILSGRFNFNFEGVNECYPESKVKFSVTNGKFKLYFWNEPSIKGLVLFTTVESLWKCYESEKDEFY